MIAELLAFSLLLVASLQGVIVPIMAENYDSAYFICIMSTSQFSLFLVFSFLIYKKCCHKRVNIEEHEDEENGENADNPYVGINDAAHPYYDVGLLEDQPQRKSAKSTMIFSGIFMGFSSLFVVYSSNPERTPIVFQLILNGITIVPSFLLTKYYLQKQVDYNKKYCILSLVTLLISIGISIIPIDSDVNFDTVLWPIIFLLSIIFRVIGYILQEKYFMVTEDRSTYNKLYNIVFCRFVQLIVTLLCFWFDVVIGYSTTFDPLTDDFNKLKNADTNFILLEVFVISTVFFCVIAGYLNSISTNYSSVALTLVTPVVGMFFSIFPQLNDGKNYPLYITIPSLFFNLLSSYCWMKGEKH